MSQEKLADPCVVYEQVIAATNRADILDPALMRSGRLDRKIEFPHPTEEARARILQVLRRHYQDALAHPEFIQLVVPRVVHGF